MQDRLQQAVMMLISRNDQLETILQGAVREYMDEPERFMAIIDRGQQMIAEGGLDVEISRLAAYGLGISLKQFYDQNLSKEKELRNGNDDG